MWRGSPGLLEAPQSVRFCQALREDGAGNAGVCLTSADNKVVTRPLEQRWTL